MKLESSEMPLLAQQQGGVAERSIKAAKHPLIARPGWFSDENKRKTTPSAPIKDASGHLFMGAATPPCSSARRGILLACNLFTPSMSAQLPRISTIRPVIDCGDGNHARIEVRFFMYNLYIKS